MFAKLFKRRDKTPSLADQLPDVLRAIALGQGAVATVWGLPHRLSKEVLRKRFADKVTPSSEAFAQSGVNGYWEFPTVDEAIVAQIHADAEGRLVKGIIYSQANFAGITLTTTYSRFDESPIWYLTCDQTLPEGGELLSEALKQSGRFREGTHHE